MESSKKRKLLQNRLFSFDDDPIEKRTSSSEELQRRNNEEMRDLLVKKRQLLVDNINISNGLMTSLLSKRVILLREKENIEHNCPDSEKIERLLDILSKKGWDEISNFFRALNETNQSHVVRELTKEWSSLFTWALDLDLFLRLEALLQHGERKMNGYLISESNTKPPEGGWHKAPSKDDPSVSAAIATLLNTRKHLNNTSIGSMTKEQFEEIFGVTVNAILTICSQDPSSDVTREELMKFKTASFDSDIFSPYFKSLVQLGRKEDKNMEMKELLKHQVEIGKKAEQILITCC